MSNKFALVSILALGSMFASAEESQVVHLRQGYTVKAKGALTNSVGEVIAYRDGLTINVPHPSTLVDAGVKANGFIFHSTYPVMRLYGAAEIGSGGIRLADSITRFGIYADEANSDAVRLTLTDDQVWSDQSASTHGLLLFHGSGKITDLPGRSVPVYEWSKVPLTLAENKTLTVSNLNLYVVAPDNDLSKGTLRLIGKTTYYPILTTNAEAALHARKMVVADGSSIKFGSIINDLFYAGSADKMTLSKSIDSEHLAEELVFENGTSFTVQDSSETCAFGLGKLTVTNTTGAATTTTIPSGIYNQTKPLSVAIGRNATLAVNAIMMTGDVDWRLSGEGTLTFASKYLKITDVSGFTGTLNVTNGLVVLPARSTWPAGMTVTTSGTGCIAEPENNAPSGVKTARHLGAGALTEDITLDAGDALYVTGNNLVAGRKVTMTGTSAIYIGATATIASEIIITNKVSANANTYTIAALGANTTATFTGLVHSTIGDDGHGFSTDKADTDYLSALLNRNALTFDGDGKVVMSCGTGISSAVVWDGFAVNLLCGDLELRNGHYMLGQTVSPEKTGKVSWCNNLGGPVNLSNYARKFLVGEKAHLDLATMNFGSGIKLDVTKNRCGILEVGPSAQLTLNNNRGLTIRYGQWNHNNATNLVRLAGGKITCTGEGGLFMFETSESCPYASWARFEMTGGTLKTIKRWNRCSYTTDACGCPPEVVWKGGTIQWYNASKPAVLSGTANVAVTIAGPSCVLDCSGTAFTNSLVCNANETVVLPWTWTDDGCLTVTNGTGVFNVPLEHANIAVANGARAEVVGHRIYGTDVAKYTYSWPKTYATEAAVLSADVTRLTLLDAVGGTFRTTAENPVSGATLVLRDGGTWPDAVTGSVFENAAWTNLVFAEGSVWKGDSATRTCDLGDGTLTFTNAVTTAFSSLPNLASESAPLFRAASVTTNGVSFARRAQTRKIGFLSSGTAIWRVWPGFLLFVR